MVPTQGSPNEALFADTLHDPLPTHALETTEAELDDSHNPEVKAPQLPPGVP
jgi:hypothetical protein